MMGKKAVSSENFSIRSEDPNSPDAQTLLDELLIGPYCRFDRETVNGAVLARVEMAAAQFGFLALNSEVSEQNLRMLVFYQARGFIPTGSTSGHRSAGPGVCYLQKRLRQEANYFWSLLR
jgi:hypothetical protein